MLLRRKKLGEKELARKSEAIGRRLFRLREFKDANSVMFYVAMKDEVRTESMIRASLEEGKRVIVPSLRLNRKNILPSLLLDYDNDLEEGVFGISEPKVNCIRPFPAEKIDIVLVPGVSFDLKGGRLGFGGGYYDRFISSLKPGTHCFGLAFEFQIVEKLPLTKRDIPVHGIITEKRIIRLPR